jgi:NAD-dependent deacetylase
MMRVVVLSGAGISAESGIKTFRASDGLWENYNIEDVATPEAWRKNPELVLEFYNQRRRQLAGVQPNAGHIALTKLQEMVELNVVTQNVDDLHERAGSRHVLHLHGELTKARSTGPSEAVSHIAYNDVKLGMTCAEGYQLRPHIVWFGEMVPALEEAAALVEKADALIIVGTSLNVYPAAGLHQALPAGNPILLIDPAAADLAHNLYHPVTLIAEPASTGLAKACDWIQKFAAE